jgi:hypothetical protein
VQLVGVRRGMVARRQLPRWTLRQAGLARCVGQVGKTKEGDVKESGGDAAGDAAGPSGMLAAEKAAKERSKEKEKEKQQAVGGKRTSEGAGLE